MPQWSGFSQISKLRMQTSHPEYDQNQDKAQNWENEVHDKT